MAAATELLIMTVRGVPVASYLDGSDIEPTLARRPYLHPVTTLGGTVVTAATPPSHRWHTGVCVSIPDVSGANFWGDHSYVHGQGYVRRENQGRIVHEGWLDRGDGWARESLTWLDHDDRPLLTEVRELRWQAAESRPDRWELAWAFTLTAVAASPVRIASPGANGRPDGGYGGFFWRLPDSVDIAIQSPAGTGEALVHNRTAPWFTWSARTTAGQPYSLTFMPGDEATAADPWFVRQNSYPGAGSALAPFEPVLLAPGDSLARRVRVLVGDGMDRT